MQHVKIPTTVGPVMEAITQRWSPRSFADKLISETDLNTLVEAASWAFSAFNEQPWRYIAAHRGTPAFEMLWSLLAGGNQPWCKNAAVLLVTIAKTQQANGNPNPWAHHDLGAANYGLMLQARSMDIYGHVMAGFNKAGTVQALGLTPDLEPLAMIALGYLDAPEKLPEPFLTREQTPRSRKAVAEILQVI